MIGRLRGMGLPDYVLLILLAAALSGFLIPPASAANVTLFNESYSEISMVFTDASSSPQEFYISVPNGTVISATMRLTGDEGQMIKPADIMLVTDTSGTMGEPIAKLDAAKAADISFVNSVDFSSIQVGLAHYSNLAYRDYTLTTDGTALIDVINSYSAGGYTNMGQGMNLSIDELLSIRAQPGGMKYMLVMTDGIANCYPNSASPTGFTCDDGTTGRRRAREYVLAVAKRAAANNIVIFGVGFGSDANMNLISNISNITGGSYYYAPTGSELIDIYNLIAEEITVRESPTPIIRTISPRFVTGWRASSQFQTESLWTDDSCGWALAGCNELDQVIQINLDHSADDPTRIVFSVSSSTMGTLTLSDLKIEVEEPSGFICPVNNDTRAINMSDRIARFNSSLQPAGYTYNLRNMLDQPIDESLCKPDSLELDIADSLNFNITDNGDGTITIVPNSPDWSSPTSESLLVEGTCEPAWDEVCLYDEVVYGNSDVILVTDFSGSMKKAVVDWTQGDFAYKCDEVADIAKIIPDTARRTEAAECMDARLIQIVMNYSGNRIWPLFIYNDGISSYAGDPEDNESILEYVLGFGPQGEKQTCLACSINRGYDLLRPNYEANRTRFIILMTDGVPTHCPLGSCTSISTSYGSEVCSGFCDSQGQNLCSATTGGCADEQCLNAEDSTRVSAARAINDLDTIFYTIGFGPVESCERSQYLLGDIAADSGGAYYRNNSAAELAEIYEEIAHQIISTTKVKVPLNISMVLGDSANLTIIYDMTMACGNGILEPSYGEQCDDGNLDPLDGCSPACQNETPELVLMDAEISFGYSYFPDGYNYSLVEMISDDAWFPWPTDSIEFAFSDPENFSVSVLAGTTSNLTLIPTLPQSWYAPTNSIVRVKAHFTIDGKDYDAEANLKIIYTGEGMPEGTIECNDPAFRYLLHSGQVRYINFEDVFSFDGDPGGVASASAGTPTAMPGLTFTAVELTSDFDSYIDGMNALADGFVPETEAWITITTDHYITQTCPVRVFSLGSNCEKPICSECTTYDCLYTNNCLDRRLAVLNPYTPIRPYSLMPAGVPDYTVSSFGLIQDLPPFVITPSSPRGDKFEVFQISGDEVENGEKNAAVLKVIFTGYGNEEAQACPELLRLNYNIGIDPLDPDTELLMASSRSVVGYYDFDGQLISEGPYIFTAKVWQRK